MTSLLKAFVLPVFSSTFYQQVLKWRTLKVWVFVFLFVFVTTIVSSGVFVTRAVLEIGPANLGNAKEKLWQEYTNEVTKLDFTYIGVTAGEFATDLRSQPYTRYDRSGNQVTFFGVDTTGKVTNIPSDADTGILVTKESIITKQSSGVRRTILMSETFKEDFRLSKNDLISANGPAYKFYTSIWTTIVWVVLGIIFVVYPIVVFVFVLIKMLVCMLVFGAIIRLMQPATLGGDKLGMAFTQALFLFVPLHYAQSVLNFGIDLLPSQISQTLCLFRFTWILLAGLYIVLLIVPSYKKKS